MISGIKTFIISVIFSCILRVRLRRKSKRSNVMLIHEVNANVADITNGKSISENLVVFIPKNLVISTIGIWLATRAAAMVMDSDKIILSSKVKKTKKRFGDDDLPLVTDVEAEADDEVDTDDDDDFVSSGIWAVVESLSFF